MPIVILLIILIIYRDIKPFGKNTDKWLLTNHIYYHHCHITIKYYYNHHQNIVLQITKFPYKDLKSMFKTANANIYMLF